MKGENVIYNLRYVWQSSGSYPQRAKICSSCWRFLVLGPEFHSSMICCDTFNVPFKVGVKTRRILDLIALGLNFNSPARGFLAAVSVIDGISTVTFWGGHRNKLHQTLHHHHLHVDFPHHYFQAGAVPSPVGLQATSRACEESSLQGLELWLAGTGEQEWELVWWHYWASHSWSQSRCMYPQLGMSPNIYIYI